MTISDLYVSNVLCFCKYFPINQIWVQIYMNCTLECMQPQLRTAAWADSLHSCLITQTPQGKKRIVVYVQERERDQVEKQRGDDDDDEDKGLSGMLSSTLGKLLGRKEHQETIAIDVAPADKDEMEWARMVAGDDQGTSVCVYVSVYVCVCV
jgi:hypothetical protein